MGSSFVKCIVSKIGTMRVNTDEFPVVLQAYQTAGTNERFVAEQVVNTQAEIDNFSALHTGLLIKARKLQDGELGLKHPAAMQRKKSRGSSTVLVFLLLVIIALVVAGFATGWIQRNFGITLGN